MALRNFFMEKVAADGNIPVSLGDTNLNVAFVYSRNQDTAPGICQSTNFSVSG